MNFIICDWCGEKFFGVYQEDEGMYCFHCQYKMKYGVRPPPPERWIFDKIIASVDDEDDCEAKLRGGGGGK